VMTMTMMMILFVVVCGTNNHSSSSSSSGSMPGEKSWEMPASRRRSLWKEEEHTLRVLFDLCGKER